jgi:two-component system sensor histidine kinase RegB
VVPVWGIDPDAPELLRILQQRFDSADWTEDESPAALIDPVALASGRVPRHAMEIALLAIDHVKTRGLGSVTADAVSVGRRGRSFWTPRASQPSVALAGPRGRDIVRRVTAQTQPSGPGGPSRKQRESMADLVAPRLALRWLGLARRGTLAAQILVMVAAEAKQLHLHSPLLVAGVVAWAAWDLALVARFRRRDPPRTAAPASGAVDIAALTALLALSGGPHHPLLFGYLAWLALLAMALPAPQAWAATAAAVGLEALVVLFPVASFDSEPIPPAHLLSHVVTFDVAAVTITWVVTQLSVALRVRDAAEREAQRRRTATERLAALGTLAAGVAHELGTPLGAIQLLTEQAARQAADGPVASRLETVLEQVARCRAILDRLRGRDTASDSESTLDLDRWVTEWLRAAPGVEVTVRGGRGGERVAGPEEGWRAALWVALDNAKKAGAGRVGVCAEADVNDIWVTVDDDGHGLGAQEARTVGGPFQSGWEGMGLGLFVSRSFAQSVGGEVQIEPRGSGGARVSIRLPRRGP